MNKRYGQRILAILYIAYCVLPLINIIQPGGTVSLAILDHRRMGLFVNSVLLGLLVAVLCTILGFYTAIRIHNSRYRYRSCRWWFLLFAPLPQYIYALSWMEWIRFLGTHYPPVLRLQVYGLLPCVVVETMGFLPLCTGFALLGLERLDSTQIEMGQIYGSDDQVLYRICLPQLLPWLFAGIGCVFVLSITDFSIPSLFQYTVYAMELFSNYAAFGKTINALYLALPLILLAAVVVYGFQKRLRNINLYCSQSKQPILSFCKVTTAMSYIALILSILQIVIPFSALLIGLGSVSDLLASILHSWPEFWISCRIGLLSALLAISLTGGTALFLARYHRKSQLLYLLPLAFPGAFVGIGWLALVNGSFLHVLSTTILLPVLGCTGRFMPFALLLMTGIFMRLDNQGIEAARLLQCKKGQAFWQVILPMVSLGFIAGGLLVFLLVLADVSVTLLLVPPGIQPISLKVYNYLHYGASETVSGLCLFMMIICASMVMFLLRIMQGKGKQYD